MTSFSEPVRRAASRSSELPVGHATAVTGRRGFLVLLAAGAAALVVAPGAMSAAGAREHNGPRVRNDHPEPRPGIDGSNVLTAKQLGGAADLIVLFNGVRAMPHIADGIRCYCGCAAVERYRSLLSCYEGVGMAQHCEVCQGEARLAHSRWKEGQSLDQIRRAIDARFGG
ncbi:MAG: hypothetical protein ACR2HZ_12680 [Gemmatimonadaceae bacterium]|jgi:hypothetical protein